MTAEQLTTWQGLGGLQQSRGNSERPAARLAAEPASTQPFNLLTALMQLLPQ